MFQVRRLHSRDSFPEYTQYSLYGRYGTIFGTASRFEYEDEINIG